MKLLIAYDGSPDAKAAVALAGHMFDSSTAVILTVWEGFSEVVARAGSGLTASLDFEQIDAECEMLARNRAEEGVGHARASGLQAEARVIKRDASTAEAILAEAEAVGADLVVVGSRGLGAVKSVLLGSVSRGVLQRARLPVLVAPAGQRHAERAGIDAPFLSAKL